MIINSSFILPQLRELMRHDLFDSSRHLLCPNCKARTKLYTLKDNRKKCQRCEKKFTPQSFKQSNKMQVFADCLLCFCLGFTAKKTQVVCKIPQRAVLKNFTYFRTSVSRSESANPIIPLVQVVDIPLSESKTCQRCSRKQKCSGHCKGDATSLAITIEPKGKIKTRVILPTRETSATANHNYDAFICKRKLHMCNDVKKKMDSIESFWAWCQPRLAKYQGIKDRSYNLYLQQLVWFFNHRDLDIEDQAIALLHFLPRPIII